MTIPFKLLLEEARACQICAKELQYGPRPVFQFHPSAKILIAGQAPGMRVHKSGVPFSDPSGVQLRRWMGVSEEEFYDPAKIAILPMGFCFPGYGKAGGDLPPRRECAPAWREQFLGRLTGLQLTLVIGQYAIAYHLPDAGATLTDVVRGWRSHWPRTLPVPHPSPRNKAWIKRNPWFAEDVLPALRQRVADALGRQSSTGVDD